VAKMESLQFADPPEGYEGPLKWIKFHGHIVPYNSALGITLKWFNHIQGRITKKLSTKIIVVGEAGISKTYTAIAIAQFFDPRFSAREVIFGHRDYMELTLKLRAGRWIVLDEPSYVLGKREWYNELNKILVQTIESDRYRVHPLLIPIISKDLLDKTLREHLIQFMIIMWDLGRGDIYRLTRDHFNDKVLYHHVCGLKILTPKRNLQVECGKHTCLECAKLPDCNKFIWPKYERKRNEIQMQRYKKGMDDIEVKEKRKQSFRERITASKQNEETLTDEDGRYDITKLMLFHRVGEAYAYRLRKALEGDYETS